MVGRARWGLLGVLLASLLATSGVIGATPSFAATAFQQQWQRGETLTPNFWGPLATAREGQQEPYKEATDGTRLVQYFDKGRMESGPRGVTNGLLATELVTGRVQIGDTTFEERRPPNIPIAGDPLSPGPTYAALATTASTLLAPSDNQSGGRVVTSVGANGEATIGDLPANPGTTLATYDSTTKHNVARAFADYRTKAGLATIGYAIAEPFATSVKVGGQQREVVVQVFERRTLTYTATNPTAFRVEMGNVGQHYYRWRYGASASGTATPGTTVDTLMPAIAVTGATTSARTAPVSTGAPTPTPDPAPTATAPSSVMLLPAIAVGTPAPVNTPIPATLAGAHPTVTPVAANYRVVASVSDSTPASYTRVTVTATLTNNGQGVAGATVDATWHLKLTDLYCTGGPSGADGAASCVRDIGQATPGYTIFIDLRVTFAGQVYTTQIRFTPR